MRLTENAVKVLEKRYLAKDEEGNLCETPEDMFRRVAATVASADKERLPEKKLKKLEEEFYDMMADLEFLPNSPTLMNEGPGAVVRTSSCLLKTRWKEFSTA